MLMSRALAWAVMIQRHVIIATWLLVAAILTLPATGRAQKIVISRLGGQMHNVLQVEGMNGQPVTINYTFNYHRKNLPRGGEAYYQQMHDEVVFSAGHKKLEINRDVYFVMDATGKSIKNHGKIISIATGLPGNNVVNTFIKMAAEKVSLAAQPNHSIAVVQVTGEDLDKQIDLIEKSSGN